MVHTVDIPTFVFIWAIQIKGRDSALNSAYLSFSIDTSDYLLIVRREPGGTERRDYTSFPLSMQVRLVERCYGTAPHPLTWKANVSLLILTPQKW